MSVILSCRVTGVRRLIKRRNVYCRLQELLCYCTGCGVSFVLVVKENRAEQNLYQTVMVCRNICWPPERCPHIYNNYPRDWLKILNDIGKMNNTVFYRMSAVESAYTERHNILKIVSNPWHSFTLNDSVDWASILPLCCFLLMVCKKYSLSVGIVRQNSME